jgi:YD repeat-containing protein
MRRTTILLLLVGSVVFGVGTISPVQAAGGSTKVEPLPAADGYVIENVCDFPVAYTDRGGRTLTTRYDRTGRVVSRTITGTSTVELRNLATDANESFEVSEITTIVYHRNGTATVVQLGSSGIALDPGTSTRRPDLVWYGGLVRSRGTLDERTLLFVDVTHQRRVGIEADICDILVSGLKPRH